MKYRGEIDGLRSFAILPVLFYHAGFNWMPGGFLGVDVFFVISGFLITSLLVNELGSTGRLSITGFYERRARRLLPALFTVMAVSYVAFWFVLPGGQWPVFNESLRWILAFSSNIFFLGKSGYFDADIELNPMVHTWSLAIEEQFYLLFPLILWLLWRFVSKRYFIGILTVIALISISLAQLNYVQDPTSTFYLIQFRAWELVAGSLVAMALANAKRISYSNQLWSFVGLAALTASMFLGTFELAHPGFITLIPIVGTMLVIAFAGPDTLTHKILTTKALVWIGLISYSTYLWHQPVFAFFRALQAHEPQPTDFLPLIALSLVLAWATWKFVETPFRNRARFKRKTIFALTGAMIVSVLSVTVVAALPSVQLHRGSFNTNKGLDDVCETFLDNEPRCVSGLNPNTLLWGDSHAMHLANALEAGEQPVSFVQQTLAGCPPILDVAQQKEGLGAAFGEQCLKHNVDTFEWLGRHPEIKYVILSSPWYTVLNDKVKLYHSDGSVHPDSVLAWSQFETTLLTIKQLGVLPVVVLPTPNNGEDHEKCVQVITAQKGNLSECDFPISANKRTALNKRIVDFTQKLGIPHFELTSVMCPNDVCVVTNGDVSLYLDEGHLSREGSTFIGEKFNIGQTLLNLAKAQK